MDAKDHTVISVLGDQKRFMVPIYQRQYRWTNKHWDAFWEDLAAKAEESLEGKPKFKHYMGALIIAPGSDGYIVGTTPKVQVVDGQQRLTTFQLFMVSLREDANRINFPEVQESVSNYIFNRPMSGDKDVDAKYKLVPTPEDKAAFHILIEGGLKGARAKYPDAFYKNGNLKTGSAPNAVRAVIYFMEKIESYRRYGLYDADEGRPTADPVDVQKQRLQALLEALLNHLKLVVITLDDNDDAQVIFETLNSKAEPLLAMDLVRNNIFHRAEAKGEPAEHLFETKWRPLDGPFWKMDSPRAKPRRPRIDHFLSHTLTALTGKDVSLRELYAEYRAFVRPKGQFRYPSVEDEISALVQFAPIYQSLEEGKSGTDLGWIGGKMSVWEVATAYPLIFCVAISDADDEEKLEIYRLIYSYIVRRSICGLTPKNLNKNFQRIVASMLERGVSLPVFSKAFEGQTGPAVRFPSDEEFRAAVQENPLYQMILKRERLVDILWELEMRLRTKFSVNTARPLGISLEHIMPQQWRSHWPLPDGRTVPADYSATDEKMAEAISARQALLHTVGNLTLVTVPANSAASNGQFNKKKGWLIKSLLALNLSISGSDQWTEKEIVKRNKQLADYAAKIWPAV